MGDQEWADGHLEQPGRVTGSVTVAGKCIRLATYGFRDHSYGPRDYARIIGDTWLTGVFPSGRNFLALEVWTDAPNVPPFVVGFVDDGRTRYPVTGLRLPRLSSRDGAPGRFSAEITTTSGTALIEVVQTHCMNYTFDSPVGMTLGTRDAPGDILATEGPARLRWDGEEAHGWVEKTLRFGEIGSSEISKL